jgi:hypothetical protein
LSNVGSVSSHDNLMVENKLGWVEGLDILMRV